MTRKTKLTDEEALHLFETRDPDDWPSSRSRDEIAGLDAAISAAATSDDPVAAQQRVDAEIVDAARRGIPWHMITFSLGTFDIGAVRAKYEPLI